MSIAASTTIDPSPRGALAWFTRALPLVAAFGGLLTAALCLQLASGGFQNEFGSHPDEAAHVVTGLMVRDFILQGDWSSPRAFAENYYIHYPKVAIGHWPPLFYVVQAGWTIPFGANAVALRLLMAVLSAGVGLMIYATARREFPILLSAATALVFVALPLVQWFTAAVMTELLVALLCLAATLSYGRYLRSDGASRWAIAFGLFAAAAILTKGTGLILALVPPLAILFAHRLSYLRRASFWLPAGIVVLACLPWYLYTLEMQLNGWLHQAPSLWFTSQAVPYYSAAWVRMLSAPLAVISFIGLVQRVVLPALRRRAADPRWAALGGLFTATMLFHFFIPCGREARHLVVALPPALLFAAAALQAGFLWLRARFPRQRAATCAVATAIGVFVLLAVADGARPRPLAWRWRGYAQVTQLVLRQMEQTTRIAMVCSDPQGEGALIAGVALAEDRPHSFVLRASNMLASSRWRDEDYRTSFDSSSEIVQYLRETAVSVVVLDGSVPVQLRNRHYHQLKAVIEKYPDDWKLLGRVSTVRDGLSHANAVAVYALNLKEVPQESIIEVNLEAMLGKKLRTNVVHAPR